MAVALDRPVVSLMAQADPKRTGPYRKYQDLVVDAFREPADGDAVIWQRRTEAGCRASPSTNVLARVALWQDALPILVQEVADRAVEKRQILRTRAGASGMAPERWNRRQRHTCGMNCASYFASVSGKYISVSDGI